MSSYVDFRQPKAKSLNTKTGWGLKARGYAANSGLDALLYKTKFDSTNWFIFLYVLGILVDYTHT
jgi:hypothetical protein